MYELWGVKLDKLLNLALYYYNNKWEKLAMMKHCKIFKKIIKTYLP